MKKLLLISWQLAVIFSMTKDTLAKALVKSEQPLKSTVATKPVAMRNTQVDDQLIEDLNNYSYGLPIDGTTRGKILLTVKTSK